MKTPLKTLFAGIILASVALAMNACSSNSAPGSSLPNSSAGGTKSYPLSTCIVTDNDLGSMGDEQRIVYQGQEVKFCCKPCVQKFLKNPEKYLPKIS